MRVALILRYNGSKYLGSQSQTQTQNTVFGSVQRALEALGITAKPVPSGRTDKGVHASHQVAHLDLPPYWTQLPKLHQRLNILLDNSIQIKKIIHVADDFHARFHATARAYRYIIKTSPTHPFEDDFVSYLPQVPHLNQLQEKIKLFEGTHNFVNFMKTGSETKSTQRTIFKTSVYKQKGYIILYFEADGFLRSQIRLMVAALYTFDTQQIEEMLTCKAKYSLKPAPANGLYLAKIKYKKEIYV